MAYKTPPTPFKERAASFGAGCTAGTLLIAFIGFSTWMIAATVEKARDFLRDDAALCQKIGEQFQIDTRWTEGGIGCWAQTREERMPIQLPDYASDVADVRDQMAHEKLSSMPYR